MVEPQVPFQQQESGLPPAAALDTQISLPMFTPPTEGELISSTYTGNTYRIGRIIGEGSFGVVYECTDTWENELAVKILKPLGTYEEVRENATAELQKLRHLRHPNITYVHDAFEYRHTFYIVFERCWQSITQFIQRENFKGELWLRAIARGSLQAVHFLHCNNYVHQDIHGGNVFVATIHDDMAPDETIFSFMLGDLGITKMVTEILVSLPDSAKRDRAIQRAMDTIEEDYDGLKGVLPKGEYSELDNEVLGQLLRTLNPEELKQASGDIFGRIYEYFLTQFADLKAHDGGEFFTPVSLVQMIANVIEPDHGKVLDPACGSGGMFVQSAHFVERMRGNPSEALTFYGMEKNPTTIRLAKMNLAVHGLEGDIQKAISYYEDPHELVGKADFVMANPPFNVDEVDADKIKNDPRLPFGLPGVNKAGKVSNGNYLWISYFQSYLSAKGRAGFVMSSQASSAGHGEKAVRQKLVESGDVDVMISIRSNFFYTRTVPCELWFFDRAKPAKRKDQVLMLDARNIYRKVTRKIYDFSPEQMQNLAAIVWLYRGQQQRFLGLVKDYLGRICAESAAAGVIY